MKKNFSTIVVLFGLLILLNGVTTTTGGSKVRPVGGCATTTATKTGKEVCKPVSERTFMEKTICWQLKQVGLVCKLDLACERAAHQKTEQEKKEIEKEKEEIEEEKRTQAKCASLGANHLAVSDTKLFQDASDQSKVTTEIKKNDELTLMARVTEEGKKDWIFIFTQDCKQGYVNEKYVKAKIIDDNGPALGDELSVIIEPRWTKKNKLIVIEKEGPNSLAGRIQSNKIDKIFINGEEEFIESDNSFSKLVNVPKNGLEVRIVGNKDGKKVDSLNFKIQVGY
jgi:hypothetical protein